MARGKTERESMKPRDKGRRKMLSDQSQFMSKAKAEKEARIAQVFKGDPEIPLGVLAERFGVSTSKVSEVLERHGLREKGRAA